MSTIVFQGLHSYFESQLIETTTLKLKVASCVVGYETKEKCPIQETNYKPPNLEFSGWNSIQNISNVPNTQKETIQKQSPYIHPLTKKTPRLSQKSLELCTESLGSETGSDDSIDISILSLDSSDNSTNVRSPLMEDHQNLPKQMKTRNIIKACSFPPPLTTLRSPNSIQVRPYREDGRLIIEAVEVPTRNTHLQAERNNGRLILRYVSDSANDLDYCETTNEDNAAMETSEHEINHLSNCEEEGDDYEEKEGNMNEGMYGNTFDEEDEVEKENIQRPGSRCKESQHGDKSSCFWRKPLCVETS